MNERARRTKRFVSPDRLHKDLENALAASPSIPFPDPHKSRASRLGSRLLVLFQIVVFIGAVMIPLAAVAADPAAAPEAAPAEAAAAPDPTPEPTPDPTPEPTPEPTPAPTPDPTPAADCRSDGCARGRACSRGADRSRRDGARADTSQRAQRRSIRRSGDRALRRACHESRADRARRIRRAQPEPMSRTARRRSQATKLDYPPGGAVVTLTGRTGQPAQPSTSSSTTRLRQLLESQRRSSRVAADGTRSLTASTCRPGSLPTTPSSRPARRPRVATTDVHGCSAAEQPGPLAMRSPTGFSPATYTGVTSGNNGWSTGNNNGPYSEGDTVPYRTRLPEPRHLGPTTASRSSGIRRSRASTRSTTSSPSTQRSSERRSCASLTGFPPVCVLVRRVPSRSQPTRSCEANADWIANTVRHPGSRQSSRCSAATSRLSRAYTTPANYTGDTSTSITGLLHRDLDRHGACAGAVTSRSRQDWGPDSSARFDLRLAVSRFPRWQSTAASVGDATIRWQAGAIVANGTIVIVKDAVPNSATELRFSLRVSPTSSSTTTPIRACPIPSRSASPPGDYDGAELTPPAGWSLTNLPCDDPDNQSNST